MVSKYTHISFDLDGTLVHTMPEYRHAIVPQVVRELGGSINHPYAIDRFWFETGRNEIIQKEFNLDPDIFWERFNMLETVENRALHTWAYDDVEPCLRELKKHGKIISVLTGAPQHIARMELAKLNDIQIDIRLSLKESGYEYKPHPGSLLSTMKTLGVGAHETVYIGNSNEDAYYAQNAGVDFIYLERKEHEFDLKDYAIATIHSLAELI